MLYFDFASGRYFLKDQDTLEGQLHELEEKSQKGNPITLTDYFSYVGLPIISYKNLPIGSRLHNLNRKHIIGFELIPSVDCTVIYPLT